MQNKQVVHAKDDLKSITALWQGPLPHPSALRQYEEVLPGTAERILCLAERSMDLADRQSEQKHQAEMETIRSLSNDNEKMHENTRRGQIVGGFVALFAFSTALGAVALGSPVVALAVVGATIATIVQALVVSGKHENDERK